MRIILICGIVLIHIPFDAATSPYSAGHGAFHWLHIYLRDCVFHAGVPCLSMISGYLLFRKSAEMDYSKLLRLKVRTIAIPFLIWNIALFTLVAVAETFGFAKGYFPVVADESFMAMVNQIFAITAYPIDLPTYFMRDLLVCFLLSPLIGALVTRAPIPTLAALFAAAALSVETYVFLRADIAFSFAAGAAIAIHRVDTHRLDRHAMWLTGLFLLLSAGLTFILANGQHENAFWTDLAGKILNFFGVIAFWTAGAQIEKLRIGAALARAGRYSFWIFCGHYPVLLSLWMVWSKLNAPPAAYPLFFLLAFPATISALIVAHTVLSVLSPRFMRMLTGHRVCQAPAPVLSPSAATGS